MILKHTLLLCSWMHLLSVGLLVFLLVLRHYNRLIKKRLPLWLLFIWVCIVTLFGYSLHQMFQQRYDIRDILLIDHITAIAQMQTECNRIGDKNALRIFTPANRNSQVQVLDVIWWKPTSALSFTTEPQKYEGKAYSRFRAFRVKVGDYPNELVVFGALGKNGWEVMSSKPCEPKDLNYGSLFAIDMLHTKCCVE